MSRAQTVWIVYGPAGCGKSHLCNALAQTTSGLYIEGDEYHSDENVAKMRAGQPLQDCDRQGWLRTLVDTCVAQAQREDGRELFMSCSALRSTYRDVLRSIKHIDGRIVPHFIYLKLDYEIARKRAASRLNHYMADTMVYGQYQILEEPQAYESDIAVADASLAPEELIKWARKLVSDCRVQREE